MDKVKLLILASQASANPPIGPLLGQKGVNAVEFTRQFNDVTKSYHPTALMTTRVFVENKKFSLSITTPSIVSFLKKAARIRKSSGTPNLSATLSIKWVYELAVFLKETPQYSSHTVMAICKMILGTAKSMHLEITD